MEQIVPTINGSITRNSIPIVGGHIYVDVMFEETKCRATAFGAATNQEGKFTVVGETRFLLQRQFADSLKKWRVCLEVDGDFVELWRHIGVSSPPGRLEMRCDANAPHQGSRVSCGICRPTEA